MKAVLLSIKRKWARKILSGEKTVEIRKTAPRLPTPFTVFMYETKADGGKGAIIGSFTCDEVFDVWTGYDGNKGDDCLTYDEQEAYLGEYGHGYGWHIQQKGMKYYPGGIDLGAFVKSFDCPEMDCFFCKFWKGGEEMICEALHHLKRPPQSWEYVEIGYRC